MLALSADRASDEAACAALLRQGSKSFALAALLLPRRVRMPATILYAFCRIADDAVDEGDEGDEGGGAKGLAAMRDRLARAYEGKPADHPVDRAFARLVHEEGVPRVMMEALLEGFAWDAEGRQYRDLSQLTAYAARVAGTVGAMMTLLMGARDPRVLARACDLGVAMQLTNIARDVGEDARNGRLYLPLDWMAGAGVDPAGFLASPRPSPAVSGVVQRLLRHASILYARADAGIDALPRDCRAAIRAASLVYAAIGREVERRGFDAVSSRAFVPGWRKLWLLLRALTGRSRPVPDTLLLRPLPETQFLVDAVPSDAPSALSPPSPPSRSGLEAT